MVDDLYALAPLPGVVEIDVLDEEEAAFHPLEGNRSMHPPTYPGLADRSL